MKNSFDSRLPQTTTYVVKNNVMYITHRSYLVSKEEAIAIAELLQYSIDSTQIKALVIDNRKAQGAWPKDILDVWMGMNINPTTINKKNVTLTNGVIAEMQMNRIAKQMNMEHISRAFNSGITKEVIDFINS